MFSKIFSQSDKDEPNFHPVTTSFQPGNFFGALEPQDLEWTLGSGFATETQTWYHVLEDGTFLLCQVIHSSTGAWFPTVQLTCKVYNPTTKEQIWKSVNVSKFTTPPPASGSREFDKSSSKSDRFTIIHSPASTDKPESFRIDANPSDNVQISIVVTRPADVPGFKLGSGPKGGFSQFGTNPEKPEGYVVHRFWPRTACSGHVILNGRAIEATGIGMFVHAIQGMRPDVIAQRWNFANFQSKDEGGVSAIQMEFTTLDSYGRKGAGSGGVKVNVGAVCVGGKLALVTGETAWPDEEPSDTKPVKSRARHMNPLHDQDTGYNIPSQIGFEWSGPWPIIGASSSDVLSAELIVDVGTPDAPKGLMEKVDVLAELPYVVRKMVNYVAGTKPYIYQYFNPAVLNVKLPAGLIEGKDSISAHGTLFNEATFISNP